MTVAAAPCQKESPNRIGNAPRTLVAKVFAPPKQTRNRSSGRASRSASGICSTPYVSTSVIDCRSRGGGAAAGGGGLLAGSCRGLLGVEASGGGQVLVHDPDDVVVAAGQHDGLPLVQLLLALGVRTVVRTRCVTTATGPSSCTCRSLLSHPTTRQPSVTQESHRARYAARPAMAAGSLWNRNVASGARHAKYAVVSVPEKASTRPVERRQGLGLVERWQGGVGHAGSPRSDGLDARGARAVARHRRRVPGIGHHLDMTSKAAYVTLTVGELLADPTLHLVDATAGIGHDRVIEAAPRHRARAAGSLAAGRRAADDRRPAGGR